MSSNVIGEYTPANKRFVLDFPTRMNDGRQFTDFRSSGYINLPEQNYTSYQYRQFLKQNAETIINNSRNINKYLSTCSTCSDYDIVKPDSPLTCKDQQCLSQIDNTVGGGAYFVDNNKLSQTIVN